MSAKKEREKRREERVQAEGDAATRERRERLLKLGSAAGFLAIIAIAALVVISQSGGGGGGADVEGAADVRGELAGIPQRGMVLGDPNAPVTLIEFGDLQCPVCKSYSEDVLPQVIDSKVRVREAKVEFRNFTIIGPDSEVAAAAALAAGRQDRGWDFVELFYRNQGLEGSGYVDDEFLTGVAEGARVPDIDRWQADRESKAVLAQVAREMRQAEQFGLSGTPSFLVEGPLVDGAEVLGTPGGAEPLEAAIDAAG